jgi:hypothetical protein
VAKKPWCHSSLAKISPFSAATVSSPAAADPAAYDCHVACD